MIEKFRVLTAAVMLLMMVASCDKKPDLPPEPEPVPVSDIRLNKTAIMLIAGNSETLTTSLTPGNATDQTVIWTSSNPETASVDNGVITALSEGSAIITATASSGKTASCTITVIPNSHLIAFTFTGNRVEFSVTSSVIFVDWGDGSALAKYDEHSDGNDNLYVSYTYKNDAEHTVRIMQAGGLSLFACTGQLTALDVSNCYSLKQLWCGENLLTELNVSNNTALTLLRCNDNQLSALDVSKNTALTELICDNNRLARLDVSWNTELTFLSCDYNQIGFLDVSRNTELTELSCDRNLLTGLSVSNNPKLKSLNCIGNQLSRLGVSNAVALEFLSCPVNELSSLDISTNTALRQLHCGNNRLSSLDVSKNMALWVLSCDNNRFGITAINRIFTDLPDLSGSYTGGVLSFLNNPGSEGCDPSIATAKNWGVNN
jgi:hypothetical protein